MLLPFKYFISEQTIFEAAASKDVDNDDKGKLHELLLAKHLGIHLDPKGEGQLPEHWRGDKNHPNKKLQNKSPTDVHDDIRNRISKEAYDEINSHAKQTAEATIQHLIKNGHIKNRNDITNIHWTSNRDTEGKAGDHERTTSVKDTNSNADLILTTKSKNPKSKFIGVSAKYGSNNEPNYRNDGLESLEKKAGLKPGAHSDFQSELDSRLAKEFGYVGTKEQRHNLFKVDRENLAKEKLAHKAAEAERLQKHIGSGKTKSSFVKKEFVPKTASAKKAVAAQALNLEYRTKMAKQHAAGLQKMAANAGSDQPLREYINSAVSPATTFHHIVAHSHVQDDGSANSIVHDSDQIAPNHINQFSNIRVAHGNTGLEGDEPGEEGGGMSVKFVGTHKKTGKDMVMARQDFKAGNGPTKGNNGTFRIQAPSDRFLKGAKTPENLKTVKDTETKEPVKIPAHVPANATVLTPKKLSDVRPSVPMQQRKVAQTDSPFQAMAKPGVSRVIPKPIHYRHIDENINESFLNEAKEQNLPHINDWMAERDNEHLSNKVDTGDYYREVGAKLNTAKPDRSMRGWSINEFTMNSRPINKHLIATNNKPNEKLTLDQREKIPHLDSFIQDNKIPHDVTTYSAVGFDPRKKIVDGSMDSPAYISTTPDKLIAKNYIDRGSKARQKAKHFISFNLKKGQLAANITNHSSTDNGYGTGGKYFRPHNEVLIGRGARLHYSHTDSYQDPKTGTKFHVHHMSVTHGHVDPSVKMLPPPSRRLSPEGIPEHMPQAHRDTESYMGFKL